MAKRTTSKKSTKVRKAKVEKIEIGFLNPERFPDLESVRDFLRSSQLDALRYACHSVLDPDGFVVPQKILDAARSTVWGLIDDLAVLARAAANGKPVRAVQDTTYEREGGILDEQRCLLMLAIAREGGHWRYVDIRKELIRLLDDDGKRDDLELKDEKEFTEMQLGWRDKRKPPKSYQPSEVA